MNIYDERTIARFWNLVDRRGENECWDWKGNVNDVRYGKGNYGKFRINNPRSMRKANIVAYEIIKGETNKLNVCHTCDRPICCNPNHLWLGTNQQNQLDASAKGRSRTSPQTGGLNSAAKLNENDVTEIKRLILIGRNNTEIGYQFGVTHSTISAIRRGKTWTHL